jgi:hypothetical protein
MQKSILLDNPLKGSLLFTQWPHFQVSSGFIIGSKPAHERHIPYMSCTNLFLVHHFMILRPITNLSLSRRREAPCEGTNSAQLFTPGETKALAKSKVHQ